MVHWSIGRTESVDFPLCYWRALKRRAGRPFRNLQRQRVRLGYAEISTVLESFEVPKPDLLMVHSSLSSCGQIRGGAPTVLRALTDWTAGGTLIMPTHTYCYPDGVREAPLFSVQGTPSKVGALTDYFRQCQGAVRSLHPTHSVACLGPRSVEICTGHELCDTPCGPGTPYERIINADASVLMFGVPMSCYTLFYWSEHAAGVQHLYYRDQVRVRMALPTGAIRTNLMWRMSSIPRCFVEAGERMEEEGLLKSRLLGRGTLRLIPSARSVHHWLLERLKQDPEFLVASSARRHEESEYRQAGV